MIQDPITKVYEYLRECAWNEVRNWVPPHHHYWASEAGGCLRRVYYRLSGVRPAPETPDSMLLSMDGDVHHDVIRQLFEKAGVEQRAIEEDIRKTYHYKGYDLEVSGRADGEISTPLGWSIEEIKTKGMGFKYYRAAYAKDGFAGVLERMRKKDRTWEYQAQFMMDMRELDTWCLVLKDRDFGPMGFLAPGGEIPVCGYLDRDPAILDAALDRLVVVEKAIESGEPPIHGHIPSAWQCEICRWRYTCHDAEQRAEQGLEPHIVYPGPLVDKGVAE